MFTLYSSPMDYSIPGQFVVVGLGNPGLQYDDTRHNIGFKVIDALAERIRCRVQIFDTNYFFGTASIDGKEIILSKPWTYMNLSGKSVNALVKKYNVDLDNVLVICDDTALPIGQLRLRSLGTSGGHNGLQSIIDEVGTTLFTRLRCGIGRPVTGEDFADYVLSPFLESEKEEVTKMINRALDAALGFVREGIEKTMNRFNTTISLTTEIL